MTVKVTSKTFIRKTKRGNILKVSVRPPRDLIDVGLFLCVCFLNSERFQIVREHYLRDDIGCGSKVCKKCKHNDEKPLEENISVVNTGFSDKHYLLVDTNVVLHQVLYNQVFIYLDQCLSQNVYFSVIITQ